MAALGVFQEYRQLADVDEALLYVVFAGDGAQIHHLGVFGQGHLYAVDIGQLIAFGIDLVEIRVTLQHPGLRVDRLGHHPGRDGGQFGVQPPIGFEVEPLHPVGISGGLRFGGQRVGRTEFRQESPQVMRRRVKPERQPVGLLA